MKTCFYLVGLPAAATLCFAAVSDPLSHVNLFIGTVNGGNTFPGTAEDWLALDAR